MGEFRSGFIAIAGRPNVGKSTLLNHILGQKVAIVTHKAQTTRTRILGVHNRPDGQLVFLDTPGIHATGRNLLNRSMVKVAVESCQDVEVILFVMDGAKKSFEADWEVLSRLPRAENIPLVVALNKVDLVDRPSLLPRIAELSQRGIGMTEVVPVSALTGENIPRLVDVLRQTLPEGPRYFPEGQLTDQPESFLAGEIVREKLFMNLNQELPYSLAVRVERFEEREASKPGAPPILDIGAVVLVSRDSQKGIVIGNKGALLKKVGQAARLELETIFGTKVFLEIWVKVRKEWYANPQLLGDLGYPDGKGGGSGSVE
ncbi:MAG: GTPase Era [Magnetococcales bacterium]|nr:GTPase Era [Magnetococcales bacterium]